MRGLTRAQTVYPRAKNKQPTTTVIPEMLHKDQTLLLSGTLWVGCLCLAYYNDRGYFPFVLGQYSVLDTRFKEWMRFRGSDLIVLCCVAGEFGAALHPGWTGTGLLASRS